MRKPLTIQPSLALLIGLLLVLASLGLLRSGWLDRLDLKIYDLLLIPQTQAPPEEVMVIAIDEASLQQIGHWPWSRRIHARLIDRLTDAKTRAIALDIPLHEPDRHGPDADRDLAEAMARNGKVVLAVAPQRAGGPGYRSAALPLPILAESAAALGHTDFEVDADGRCRRLYLHAGLHNPHWPALALATHTLGEGYARHELAPSDPVDRSGDWVRQHPVLIPYTGRQGHFRYLSYADVLNGRVDLAQLQDRYVLIGASVTDLSRALPTPMAQIYHRMPGVELDANVLAGLLRQGLVTEAPIWLRNLLTVILVGVPLVVLIARGNRHVPGILGGAGLLTLLTTAGSLYGPGVWLPPGTSLLTLAVAYLLLNRVVLRRTVQEAARRTRYNWRAAKPDGLTGLPRRERLLESLEDTLPEMTARGKLLGLLVVNLKGFKSMNDQFGRAIADRLLVDAATRIRGVVRQADLMARLGGDEFAIMMAGLDNRRPIQELTKRIRASLSEPFEVEPGSIQLSVHLAAALFPADGRDAAGLLQSAAGAVRRTRETALPRVGFAADQRRARAGDRTELEAALRGALERGEFRVHYQPQVSSRGDRVVGVEALLRWHSPQHGTVPPADFLPIAERSGQIVPIGAWVLEQACRQAQSWLDAGLPGLRMAVNLSAVQIARPGLVDTVGEILDRTGMDAKQLELELRDDSLSENPGAAGDVLAGLKKLGVRLALDDFGAGYASLHSLKPFPFDRIKIDCSLTREIERGNATAEIARTIVSMAHDRKLEVVAEGVETEAQRLFLKDRECDELQGHLFAEPLPADVLEAQLRRSIYLVPCNEPQALTA